VKERDCVEKPGAMMQKRTSTDGDDCETSAATLRGPETESARNRCAHFCEDG